jgi:hypothetical protein
MVSILRCEMKKPPGNYSREALLSLSRLGGDLPFCDHICKVGAFEPFHEILLRVAPDGAQGAIGIECARAQVADTFIELNGAVYGFDHFQKSDVFRSAGESNSATSAA